jgi:hypothetical protein
VARKPADEVQLKLRFDERLRRRLAKEAERNQRSMNAEIIHRLEQSFQQEDVIEKTFNEHVVAETMVNLFSPPDPDWPFSPEFARVLRRGGHPFPGKAAVAISKLSREAGITPDEYFKGKLKELGVDPDKPYVDPDKPEGKKKS